MRLAVLMGTANPTPELLPDLLRIWAFIPMTLPYRSSNGPPELPGLMGASAWMMSGLM